VASGEHTPIRHIRVGALWEQSQAVARAHGVTHSDLVRAAIEAFIARPDLADALDGARSRVPSSDAAVTTAPPDSRG